MLISCKIHSSWSHCMNDRSHTNCRLRCACRQAHGEQPFVHASAQSACDSLQGFATCGVCACQAHAAHLHVIASVPQVPSVRDCKPARIAVCKPFATRLPIVQPQKQAGMPA
jgi:hypothetical protein